MEIFDRLSCISMSSNNKTMFQVYLIKFLLQEQSIRQSIDRELDRERCIENETKVK